jgi:maleamate amidohydrolase
MITKSYPWSDALTQDDIAVIEKGGYGKQRGFGKKPLLMIIDPQYNYFGANKPIVDQLAEWPSGGGEGAWKAVGVIKDLKDKFAEKGLPVLYTRNVQKKTLQFDSFGLKAQRDNSKYLDDSPAAQIIEELAPADNDIVVDKSYASAFFGTPLISYLIKLGVDSLIIVGGSSSGCVRATAVDAVTRNFNVAVVTDATYDRISISHKAALLDLWMKYCDVVDSEDINLYLNKL